MKISQEQPIFQPIIIKLESKKEADLFLSIIDKIDAATNNAVAPKISKEELCLVTKISDRFTDLVGLRR